LKENRNLLLAQQHTNYISFTLFGLPQQLLPREKDKGPLHVVVDSCNGMQIHTYEVQGVNARYLGPGDLHDPQHSKMAFTTTLNPYLPPPPPAFNITDLRLRLEQLQNQTLNNSNITNSSETTNATDQQQQQVDLQAILDAAENNRNDNQAATATDATANNETASSGLLCQHVLNIYPTSAYAKSHSNNNPIVYTVALVIVVGFAIFLFLIYDYVVRRQQNKVLGEAERSNAIIASLFPTQVARKLFDSAGGHAVPVGGAQGGGIGTDALMSDTDHGGRGGQRRNNRNRGPGGPGMGGGGSSALDASGIMSKGGVLGRPIAELFPEATVMFADIAGYVYPILFSCDILHRLCFSRWGFFLFFTTGSPLGVRTSHVSRLCDVLYPVPRLCFS
jgi:hypothetical protein